MTPAAATTLSIQHAKGRGRLECDQWLARPRDELFPFFADAHNLERITPPLVRFRVTGMSTPQIMAGTLIHYRLRLHGLPIAWTSRIDRWEPPLRFVDLQVRGPYRIWHHTHEFEPERGGTRIRDRVDFQLPLPFLHHTPVARLVDADLREIFTYRQRILAELFA